MPRRDASEVLEDEIARLVTAVRYAGLKHPAGPIELELRRQLAGKVRQLYQFELRRLGGIAPPVEISA